MFKNKELYKKIAISAMILFVLYCFRFIPIIGIKKDVLSYLANKNNFLGFINLLSGNGIKNLSIMSLGITPFITSSIIIELSKTLSENLYDLSNNGEFGRKKIEKLTYFIAVVFAILNSYAIVNYLMHNNIITDSIINKMISIISLFIGTAISLIGAKIIDNHGFGDGISLILFFNIINGLVNNFYLMLKEMTILFNSDKSILKYIIVIMVLIVLFIMSFIFDRKNTYVNINSSRIILDTKDSAIPIKVNANGVMPVIFTNTIMSMPALLFEFIDKKENTFIKVFDMNNWFDKNELFFSIGYLVFALLLFLFTLYYAKIAYDPFEVAMKMKESGISVDGINNTKKTALYLSEIIIDNALKSFGFMIIIATIPILINNILLIKISFAGTSFIIISSILNNLIDERKYYQIKSGFSLKR